MNNEHYIRDIMSGARKGPAAGALRAVMSLAEPFYAAGVKHRNRRFDSHPDRAKHLPVPVISVGNITTGGTGKTPVVRWLAEHLRKAGRRVAILSRGYKAAPGTLGDEQRMLDSLLNPPLVTGQVPITIRAHPDRHAAGLAALHDDPAIDVFLLDDGFQHRRLHRDLDIVLINATNPFGYDHLLPRGLLREPPASLGRAGAIILTHALSVDENQRRIITDQINRWNPAVPIFRCIHAPASLRTGLETTTTMPMEDLRSRRVYAFCGLAAPDAFEREVREMAGTYSGYHWFPDHHPYSISDLRLVAAAANATGADVLLTTEKDWAKVRGLLSGMPESPPIWRLDVATQFLEDDGERLSIWLISQLTTPSHATS